MIKLTVLSILALSSLIPSLSFADADCPIYPKKDWMKEDQLKAKIEKQGYKIKVFKVDGNCYEIYGWNSKGEKVEIYYDAKTGEPVKSSEKK